MAFRKYQKAEQVEVVAAADAPETLRKFGVTRHNHLTRDIREAGSGCPACDEYHARHGVEDDTENLTEN